MRRAIVLLAVLILLVSACSGDSSETTAGQTDALSTTTTSDAAASGSTDTTTTAANPDGSASLGAPCSYLTDTEMSDLLGKNVTSEASGELCVYAPADGSGGIELLIQDVSDVGCELIFSVGSFNGDEPVDGVGTYAAYEAGTIPRMAVCFNEQATLITTMYAAPPDPKNVLLSVASSVENGLK